MSCQDSEGGIRWEPNSKLDPWDHIESAMIWPLNAEMRPTTTVLTMLQDQNGNLNQVIKFKNQAFPICIPNNKFEDLLTLNSSQPLDEIVSQTLLFRNP